MNHCGLVFEASGTGGSPRGRAIRPGAFDPDAAGMGMASFCHPSLVAPRARGIFGRDSPQAFIRALGCSKRVQSPMSATMVTATVPCPPRKAWRASTTGCTRHVVTCSRRAWSRRPRRSVCSVMVRTYAEKRLLRRGGADDCREPPEVRGPQVARPAERISWRSTKALRRNVASLGSLMVSSRARVRSRSLHRPLWGLHGGQVSRAGQAGQLHGVPAVRFAPIPRFLGISDGATTQQASSFSCR